jgi:hypothetical protein
MNITQVKLKSGEIVEIRQAPGGYICPVCGFMHGGDPPYAYHQSVLDDGKSLSEPYGAASFDVCPSCHVEYGNDDYADGRSVASMWEQLRLDWLQRTGWSEAALAQLRENLGIPTPPSAKEE